MKHSSIQAFRITMVRTIFLFILASFVFRYYNHVMLHQLLQPVIFKTDSDLAYWMYHIVGFSKLIVQSKLGSIIFDCLVMLFAVIPVLFPSRRLPVIIFSILYPLYFLSYNAFVTHHTGTMDGILLVTFAFWSVKDSHFELWWQALRYLNLSIYSMAFFWKVFVGASVFMVTQPEMIVKDNLALYLYLNPATYTAGIIHWFLQHPLCLYVGYSLFVLMQGCMAIGFFTKRYDWLLFIIPVVFHLGTYFFVDVCYFELLILNFTFVTPSTLKNLNDYLKEKALFSKSYQQA